MMIIGVIKYPSTGMKSEKIPLDLSVVSKSAPECKVSSCAVLNRLLYSVSLAFNSSGVREFLTSSYDKIKLSIFFCCLTE